MKVPQSCVCETILFNASRNSSMCHSLQSRGTPAAGMPHTWTKLTSCLILHCQKCMVCMMPCSGINLHTWSSILSQRPTVSRHCGSRKKQTILHHHSFQRLESKRYFMLPLDFCADLMTHVKPTPSSIQAVPNDDAAQVGAFM